MELLVLEAALELATTRILSGSITKTMATLIPMNTKSRNVSEKLSRSLPKPWNNTPMSMTLPSTRWPSRRPKAATAMVPTIANLTEDTDQAAMFTEVIVSVVHQASRALVDGIRSQNEA